jgi:hypothetical protein
MKLENAALRHSPPYAGMSLSKKISLEDEAKAHLELAKDRDQLLHIIHTTVPGFEDFLQPSPCSTLLQDLPDSGPIVLINVHESRCDAIALRTGQDGPLHITLPTFSQKKANMYQQDLMAHLDKYHLRMRAAEADAQDKQTERVIRPHQGKLKEVHNILSGLWKDVVKPILNALGFSVSGF